MLLVVGAPCFDNLKQMSVCCCILSFKSIINGRYLLSVKGKKGLHFSCVGVPVSIMQIVLYLRGWDTWLMRPTHEGGFMMKR